MRATGGGGAAAARPLPPPLFRPLPWVPGSPRRCLRIPQRAYTHNLQERTPHTQQGAIAGGEGGVWERTGGRPGQSAPRTLRSAALACGGAARHAPGQTRCRGAVAVPGQPTLQLQRGGDRMHCHERKLCPFGGNAVAAVVAAATASQPSIPVGCRTFGSRASAPAEPSGTGNSTFGRGPWGCGTATRADDPHPPHPLAPTPRDHHPHTVPSCGTRSSHVPPTALCSTSSFRRPA
jgi:hypothetical protein